MVEIFVDESVKDLEDIHEPDNEDEERDKIINLFSGSESTVSVLHIKTRIDHGEVFETLMISSAKGLRGRDIKVPEAKNASFIPSFLRISGRDLTREFDKARLNERDHEVLEAFKTIDSSITDVESFSIGEPTIIASFTRLDDKSAHFTNVNNIGDGKGVRVYVSKTSNAVEARLSDGALILECHLNK